MSHSPATLHMLCGKIASGKSTLAAKLGQQPGTLRLSEDEWLPPLFSDQMASGADYARCARKLRQVLGPHVAALLKAHVSVVLDFPANTLETRAWMRDILRDSGAADQMHVLIAPDEVLLARLQARNASGTHPFAATEEQFHRFSSHFTPPTAAEGITIVEHPMG